MRQFSKVQVQQSHALGQQKKQRDEGAALFFAAGDAWR